MEEKILFHSKTRLLREEGGENARYSRYIKSVDVLLIQVIKQNNQDAYFVIFDCQTVHSAGPFTNMKNANSCIEKYCVKYGLKRVDEIEYQEEKKSPVDSNFISDHESRFEIAGTEDKERNRPFDNNMTELDRLQSKMREEIKNILLCAKDKDHVFSQENIGCVVDSGTGTGKTRVVVNSIKEFARNLDDIQSPETLILDVPKSADSSFEQNEAPDEKGWSLNVFVLVGKTSQKDIWIRESKEADLALNVDFFMNSLPRLFSETSYNPMLLTSNDYMIIVCDEFQEFLSNTDTKTYDLLRNNINNRNVARMLVSATVPQQLSFLKKIKYLCQPTSFPTISLEKVLFEDIPRFTVESRLEIKPPYERSEHVVFIDSQKNEEYLSNNNAYINFATMHNISKILENETISNKKMVLIDIIRRMNDGEKMIVFCQYQKTCQDLFSSFFGSDFKAKSTGKRYQISWHLITGRNKNKKKMRLFNAAFGPVVNDDVKNKEKDSSEEEGEEQKGTDKVIERTNYEMSGYNPDIGSYPIVTKEDINIDVAFCTYGYCKAGINLQRANKIIFMEPATTLRDYIQAYGRIDRKGQMSRKVEFFHLLIAYSYELEHFASVIGKAIYNGDIDRARPIMGFAYTKDVGNPNFKMDRNHKTLNEIVNSFIEFLADPQVGGSDYSEENAEFPLLDRLFKRKLRYGLTLFKRNEKPEFIFLSLFNTVGSLFE